MKVLATGGLGFIGSHTAVELLEAGYEVVVIDNLSNAKKDVLGYIEKITGKKIDFYEADIADRKVLERVFVEHKIDVCMHFAGFKAVGESVEKPLEYYANNIGGTLVLLDVMRKFGCKNMVFSSSATVYGDPEVVPITEDCPKGQCTNPYGQTKSMIEQMLIDLQKADERWNIVVLRYFNPIGAHKSGLLGESPNGVPNNLMPYVAQVAQGRRSCLSVFGDDYDTHDGTGVRDYIHVVDLAKGHVKAIDAIENNCGLDIYNLGTGVGYSVLDVVKTFEKVNGVKVPYRIVARREGDIARCYADPRKAQDKLGWSARHNLDDMCRDTWNFQKKQ